MKRGRDSHVQKMTLKYFRQPRFFQRHGTYIHEFLRGDPASAVRIVVLKLIDLLRSEDLRIPIGRDIPRD